MNFSNFWDHYSGQICELVLVVCIIWIWRRIWINYKLRIIMICQIRKFIRQFSLSNISKIWKNIQEEFYSQVCLSGDEKIFEIFLIISVSSWFWLWKGPRTTIRIVTFTCTTTEIRKKWFSKISPLIYAPVVRKTYPLFKSVVYDLFTFD